MARWTSLVTFALSLFIWFDFQRGTADFQFVESVEWLPALGIGYRLGVDGISMPFVLLSTLLTPICVLASWEAVTRRVKEYMIAFLVLETLMVGMFCALDLVLFYVFFEGVLIPMFLIIGVWGGARRVYAAFKFFLYTLLGSVLMLVALLTVYFSAGTTDIPTLIETLSLPFQWQLWLWLAFFASFAVKVPMWPVHTWLPDAHVEAPTAGSVILAGVLLKMGGYGFLRFSIPFFPEASEFFTPLVYTLSVVAVVYTSLVALAQEDMKKLIAYSSIAHAGFILVAVQAASERGIEATLFYLAAYTFLVGGSFGIVAVIAGRGDGAHTLDDYRGLGRQRPVLALVFTVLLFSQAGVPFTSGFFAKFYAISAAVDAQSYPLAMIAMLSSVAAAFLYLRITVAMWLGDEADERDHRGVRVPVSTAIVLVASLGVTIAVGIVPQIVAGAAGDATAVLVGFGG